MRIWMAAILLVSFITPAATAGGKSAKKLKTFNIPYKMTDTAHVLVRVKINGRGPFNYIIDTGAPVTFISTNIAKKIGLKPGKGKIAVARQFTVEGGAAHRKVGLIVHTPFQLEGMNALNFAGVELHGIIGYDILAQYRMEFDFTRPKMRWTRLNFKPPAPKRLKVKGGAPGGLSAIGSVMKVLSFFIGKRPTPKRLAAGYLGVVLTETKKRVSIANVLAGSPAHKAGLKANDRVLQVQKKKVRGVADFLRHTAVVLPGQSVSLVIRRGGTRHEIELTAGRGL